MSRDGRDVALGARHAIRGTVRTYGAPDPGDSVRQAIGAAMAVPLRSLLSAVRVPRRFIVREDRWVFLAMGTWAAVVGVVQLFDTSASHRLWLSPLWPLLLITSGAITLAFIAGGMRSFTLRSWGGGLMFLSCAGRAGALSLSIIHIPQGGTIPDALSRFGAWSMVAFLLYITWRARVPADGDTGADDPRH